ncbi:hypothetical protein Tco_0351617 [Tanacetum coccineum]
MAKNKVTGARGGQFRVSLITPTRLPMNLADLRVVSRDGICRIGAILMIRKYGLLKETLRAPAVGWIMYNMLAGNKKSIQSQYDSHVYADSTNVTSTIIESRYSYGIHYYASKMECYQCKSPRE